VSDGSRGSAEVDRVLDASLYDRFVFLHEAPYPVGWDIFPVWLVFLHLITRMIGGVFTFFNFYFFNNPRT